MIEREKSFRILMLKIGIAMLIFVVAFNAFVSAYYVAAAFIAEYTLEPVTTIATEVLYFFVYSSSFALPAIILALMTKNDKVPLVKKFTLPKSAIFYVFIGIAATLSFAYVNARIVDIFNYNDFIMDDSWISGYDEVHEVLLHILTTAVAPGIFEELLFRGVVLAKLRPYGRTPAILISAVMFALMHQNSGQFLYTLVAGIILGWVAVETNSLLCCILIHFSNNAFSVLQETAVANLGDELGSLLCYGAEFIVFVLGIVFGVIMIYRYSKKKKWNDFSAGMFEKQLALIDAKHNVSPKRLIKLTFSPTVVIFTIISMSAAVTLIITSIFSSLVI